METKPLPSVVILVWKVDDILQMRDCVSNGFPMVSAYVDADDETLAKNAFTAAYFCLYALFCQ